MLVCDERWRGSEASLTANWQLLEIRQTLEAESSSAVNWQALLSPKLIKLLGIGVALAVLQQWSGINVIFNYAEDIYRSAGYGISGILFNIVITGTINLVFTLLALGLIDRVGRRGIDVVWRGGDWRLASAARNHLSCRREGIADLVADAVHHRVLCIVVGACDLGADFGVISE
jgi:hypothetical protein